MKVNILQHTPDEGPGAIADWIHQNQHQMSIYYPAQFGVLPGVNDSDMLIILGGPMSANDDSSWIKAEHRLISQMIDQNKPILGICFGAQQMAKVLGATVSDSHVKEVGWAPVYLKTNQIEGLASELVVLHWHQETFEIPKGATLLYSSEHLLNQGFIKNNLIGLQFHLEPKASNVHEMIINDYPYLSSSVLHQSQADILHHQISEQNHTNLFKLLDYIAKK